MYSILNQDLVKSKFICLQHHNEEDPIIFVTLPNIIKNRRPICPKCGCEMEFSGDVVYDSPMRTTD